MTDIAAAPAESAGRVGRVGKTSIIVSKGSPADVHPALRMANVARTAGIEVNLLFTFFGLDMIHRARHEPAGAGDPEPGIASPEFVATIADTGAGLYACKASVDLFGMTRSDFIDPVKDVITMGEFYELAAGGDIVFT